MAQSHLIALPAQELVALLNAANAPQHTALFALVPAFRAALRAPVDNALGELAHWTKQAIAEVCGNTNHPEDWDEGCKLASRLNSQLKLQAAAQVVAPALPEPKQWGNRTCPCCAGSRIAAVSSKACNSNWFDIQHLGFEAHYCYMPADLGIPGSGDGPALEVCLDCGRVVNGTYPLPESELVARLAQYKEDVL